MTFELNKIDWSAISSIVSAVALLINLGALISLVIAIQSLRESKMSKEANIFLWSVEQIRAIRKDMLDIREHHQTADWLVTNRSCVMKVLEVEQMISFFNIHGMIDKRRFAEMWGRSTYDTWTYLEEFVRDFREQLGEPRDLASGAFFMKDFERYALYCKFHMETRYKRSW